MNERAVVERYRDYHQRMADHYKRLLEALGASEGLTAANGSASGVSGDSERQGAKRTVFRNKARVPETERVTLPLRAKREAAGVSLTRFAERLGLSASYVGQVETGVQRARPEIPAHWEAVLDQMIVEQQTATVGNE